MTRSWQRDEPPRYVVYHVTTGRPVNPGDTIRDTAGNPQRLLCGTRPTDAARDGKITVRGGREYRASLFGLRVVDPKARRGPADYARDEHRNGRVQARSHKHTGARMYTVDCAADGCGYRTPTCVSLPAALVEMGRHRAHIAESMGALVDAFYRGKLDAANEYRLYELRLVDWPARAHRCYECRLSFPTAGALEAHLTADRTGTIN